MAHAVETREKEAVVNASEKIGFMRHVFDNYQALIRSVDTKAGALLGLALFFAASVFPISKDAVSLITSRTAKLEFTSGIFLLSSTTFCFLFLGLINALGNVVKPRGARFYNAVSETENVIWQDHILRHSDNQSYFRAASQLEPHVILRNFSDQVFELAHISKAKMDSVNTGFRLLKLLALCWVTNVISGLVLIGWKR